MTVLLLLRHGRSTSNTAGTLAGRTPGVLLDEVGRDQALDAGVRLRDLSVTAVACSPMERCRQTVELALASAHLALDVDVDDRFTECDYGSWSGRKLSELVGEPLWATVQATPSQVTFPDGESMQQMADRVREGIVERCRFLDEQRAEGEPEPVLLVASHGDPIKSVLSWALAQQLDDFQRIVVDPASISVLRVPSSGAPMVLATNTLDGRLVDRLGGAVTPQLGGGAGATPA